MPRLTRLRVTALEDLAEQLRFAPASALKRQIEAAERLGGEIDREKNYTLTWALRRLTGYAADPGESEVVLVGAALAGDISALVERLSSRAGMRMKDLGAGALGLAELCARWGVDRKTIERRRREGLVGRRVLGEDGRERLAFTRAEVERFERPRRGGTPAKKAARMSAKTRETVARLGARGRSRHGWSLGEASREIGSKWGGRLEASPSAVRRALQRADREAGAPVFDARGVVSAREAEFALRAWRRGVAVEAIARRLGRSRASAHRIINERRAALLRGLDLTGGVSRMFSRKDAAEALLAPVCVREGLGVVEEGDIAAFAARAAASAAPDERDERARAVAICFLRWRAARGVAGLARFNPSAAALDEIETDLRWAALLIVAQARSQSRLALKSIEERVERPITELPEQAARRWRSAAMLAVARAAWAFDPFETIGARGQARRLAAGATAALTKALAGLVSNEELRAAPGRARAARRGGSAAMGGAEDWTRRAAPWLRWLECDGRVRGGLGLLDARSREVVELRRGWAPGGGPPMTRVAVARRLGVSEALVLNLERRGERVACGLGAKARVRVT